MIKNTETKQMVRLRDEITAVLEDASEPLHSSEITRRVLDRGRWATSGKTPESTVVTHFVLDLNAKGSKSAYVRASPGFYGLRQVLEVGAVPLGTELMDRQTVERGTALEKSAGLSFLDAAARVLKARPDRTPMHYRDIVASAFKDGLLTSSGRTPEATLNAQISADIDRHRKRGEVSRFVRHSKGLIALSEWEATGLGAQIVKHNELVRTRLHRRLSAMPPKDFEALIGRLLVALGFDEVAVTTYHNDGGIDVHGMLIVGGSIQTRMAVQVKRYKQNVQAPTVQQVRGSLGAHHERGLIITTSGFSSGAVEEARSPYRDPVALIDGGQLVALLVEHGIGVQRTSYDLIELDEQDTDD